MKDSFLQLLTGLGDRLNPVLVKELRQALRDRGFRIVLALGLVLSLVIYTFVVTTGGGQASGELGSRLLGALSVLYGISVRLYVVMWVFQSTGLEHGEGALNNLLLSHLTPLRIAIGKWLAGLVLLMLLISVLLPFAAVSFLIGGVGLGQLLVVLVQPTLSILPLAAFAVLAGAIAKSKGMRALMMAILVLPTLAPAAIYTSSMGIFGFAGASVGSSWGWQGLISSAGTLGWSFLFLGLAAAALTPPGENRSSIARLGFSAWLAIEAVCAVGLAHLDSVYTTVPMFRMTFLVGLIPLMLFVTERRQLPRSVQPLTGPLAWLRGLWLPGGRRGAVYIVVHMALLAGFLGLASLWMPDIRGYWMEGVVLYAAVLMGWLVLPTLLLARFCQAPRGRYFALGLLVVLWILAPLSLSSLGFLLGQSSWDGGVLLNPFYLIAAGAGGVNSYDLGPTFVLAMAAAVLLPFLLLAERRQRSSLRPAALRAASSAEPRPLPLDSESSVVEAPGDGGDEGEAG